MNASWKNVALLLWQHIKPVWWTSGLRSTPYRARAESRVIFLWSLRWPRLQRPFNQCVASCWPTIKFQICTRIFPKGLVCPLQAIPSLQELLESSFPELRSFWHHFPIPPVVQRTSRISLCPGQHYHKVRLEVQAVIFIIRKQILYCKNEKFYLTSIHTTPELNTLESEEYCLNISLKTKLLKRRLRNYASVTFSWTLWFLGHIYWAHDVLKYIGSINKQTNA